MWDTFQDIGDGCPLEGWSQLFVPQKALRAQWELLAGDGGGRVFMLTAAFDWSLEVSMVTWFEPENLS